MEHLLSSGIFGIEFFRSQCYVPYFFQPNVRHLTILSQETHKHPCVNNFGDYIALTHSLLSAAATAEREGNFSKDLPLEPWTLKRWALGWKGTIPKRCRSLILWSRMLRFTRKTVASLFLIWREGSTQWLVSDQHKQWKISCRGLEAKMILNW